MPDDQIPFDYLGAKKAGYSDSEIQGFLKDKYSFEFDIVGAKKSGYSDAEISDYIYKTPVKKKGGDVTGFGQNLPDGVQNGQTAGQTGLVPLKVTQKQIQQFEDAKSKYEKKKPVDADDPVGSVKNIIFEGKNPDILPQSNISSTAVKKPMAAIDIVNQNEAVKRRDAMAVENYFRGDTNNAISQLSKATGLKPEQLYDDSYDNIIKDKIRNETDQLSYERLQEAKNVQKSIAEGGDLEDMAANFLAKQDPNFANQLSTLQETGINKQQDISEILSGAPQEPVKSGAKQVLGGSTMGNVLFNFMNNSAVQQELLKNPQLRKDFKDKAANLIQEYPDFGKMYLGNLISQKMEDMGMNNGILNIVTKEEADKVVAELLKDGEMSATEELFYKDQIRPRLGLENLGRNIIGKEGVKTPGAIENVLEGGVKGFRDLGQGVAEISGIYKDLVGEKGALSRDIERQNKQVTVGPANVWHEITQYGGQFAGQSISIATGGELTKAITLAKNPKVLLAISGGMQAYGNYAPQARMLFPGNELKQRGFATIMAAIEAGTENIFRDDKIIKGITGEMRPFVTKTIEDFTAKKISAAAAKDIIEGGLKAAISKVPDAAKYFGKAVGENTIEEVVSQLGTDATQAAFEGKPLSEWVNTENLVNTAKQAFLGSAFLGALSARADMIQNKGITAKQIYLMAKDPAYWTDQINETAKLDPDFAKEAPDKLDNLNFAANLLKELDGTEMTDQQKAKYLITSLDSKIKGTFQPTATDPVLRQRESAPIIEEIAKNDQVKEDLLTGKDDGSIEGDISDSTVAPEIVEEPTKSTDNAELPSGEFQPETVEGIVEGNEPAKASEAEQPTLPIIEEPAGAEAPQTPTSEKSKIFVERPGTQLSFKGLQNVSNEFGYEDVKSRDTVTDLQELTNARQTMIDWSSKGTYEKNVKDLLTKIENRELVPTAKQRLILQQHLANKVAELREIKDKGSKEFDEKFNEVKKLKEVGQIARQEAGAALRMPQGGISHPVADYGDAMVTMAEASGVEKLTEAQKAEVERLVTHYEEKASIAEQRVADMEAKLAEMEASKELGKTAKNKKSTTKKKTAEDYKAERQKFRDELKAAKEEHEKWLKDNGIQKNAIGGGLTLTPKMIKAIGKIIGSHVDEIGNNLSEVTRRVFEEVKEFFDGITEKDIHDIIAGEYAQQRPTLTKLQADLRDLRTEAELLNRIDKVLKGEPKNERQKIERNQKITELRKQLYDLKKDSGYDDLTKLEGIKKRNETETKKIKERIANKDFETKKPTSIFDNKELQKKYPKQYKATLDAIQAREDAKHDYDIAVFREEQSRRSRTEKVTDFLSKTSGTAKAITTGIDDSAVAIQTYVSLLSRPIIGVKALRMHAVYAASQKKFNRFLTELHNSPDYQLMKDSGLSITEPQSLKEVEKEEIFNNRFNGTIKIKGKEYKIIDAALKPFERAFTTLGNAARVLAFRSKAQAYMDKGYTFENNPELFKSLASRLNTETGRGKENEHIERASKVITMGIWSPKLMASKFNLLGVSDIASIFLSKVGTKGYYRQLHPKERAEAVKDAAKFVTGVVAITYLIAWSFGGDVDDDPLSSTFMDVRMPNGKSYNFTGGFSGYIRALAQFATGKKHQDGQTKEVGRLATAGRFFRGKTPPLTSAAINFAAEEDFMGQPVTVKGEIVKLFPISVRGIYEQIDRDGGGSLLTQGLPTFFGFNVKDERDYNQQSVLKELPESVQNDFKRTKDKEFLPSKVSGKLNNKELSDKQQKELAESVSENRLKYMDINIESGKVLQGFNVKYDELSDEDKKFVLNYYYDLGRQEAIDKFVDENPSFKKDEKETDYVNESKKELFKILSKYNTGDTQTKRMTRKERIEMRKQKRIQQP